MAISKEKERALFVAGYVAAFVEEARENGLPDTYLRLLDEVSERAEARVLEVE